ncbi:MAG TPA: LysM peptidoglycan-binding domain-containing protein, partial [Deinococcales bacterium]|nr:LysM peptidoglycan-binding domain-containing protein [Deinococcales bacterium]
LDGMTLTVAPEAANRASMTCAAGTNPPGLDPEAAFLNPGDGRVYLPLSALQPFGATATLDPTGVNLNAPAATLNLGPLKTRLPSTGASLDGWRTAASGATRLDGGIAFPLALALAADQRLNFRPTDGQLFLDATPVAALYDGTPSNLVTWGGGTLVPLTALQAAGLNARQEGDHLVMTAGNLDFPIAIPEFPARASTASLKIEADEVARLQGRRRLRAAWTPVTEAAILVNGQVYLPLTPTAARWPGLTLNGTALQLNGVTIARLYEPPKAGQGLVRYHEATYLPAAVLPGFTPQDGQLTIEDGPASITLTLPPTTPRLNFQTLKTGATTPTDPTAIPTRAYTVQPGDTLYHLAQRFHTTISALQAANHLTGTTLQTGQELIVPESW